MRLFVYAMRNQELNCWEPAGASRYVGEPLELCECEPATANNGLNCQKEGWFVAGFEKEYQLNLVSHRG